MEFSAVLAGGCYRVNTPRIAYETIDDEVILLDLDKGHYFSLLGSAASIWEALDLGLMPHEIVHQMQEKYNAEPAEIRRYVIEFLGSLSAEALIVAAENPTETARQRLQEDSTPNGCKPFSAPVLEKFTDLEDLSLLDPVYEVDSSGWPTAKPAAPSG